MTSLKNLAKDYFKTFSSMNLEKLKLFFDDAIELRDWEICASGLNEVLKANQAIFENVNSIEVNPIEINEINNKVFAELSILINEEDTIKVVDIIEFNEKNKIYSIRAYKG